MGFEANRQKIFSKRIIDLPDQPNMAANDLKAYIPPQKSCVSHLTCCAMRWVTFRQRPRWATARAQACRQRLCRMPSKTCSSSCALNLSGYKYSFVVFA